MSTNQTSQGSPPPQLLTGSPLDLLLYLHASTMSLGKNFPLTDLYQKAGADTLFIDEEALEAVANGGSMNLYVASFKCAAARDTDALL